MKCACGNPMRQLVVALDDIWWSCLICGRTKPYKEGDDDMPSPRGWCNTCNKADRPLISAKAVICHSCYKRKKDAEKLKPVKPAITVPEPVEPEEISTDEEWTQAGWVKVEQHYPEGQNIPENIPEPDDYPCETPRVVVAQSAPEIIRPLRAFDRLLKPDGWLVEIPQEIATKLHDADICPDDINHLLELFINGELRRLA